MTLTAARDLLAAKSLASNKQPEAEVLLEPVVAAAPVMAAPSVAAAAKLFPNDSEGVVSPRPSPQKPSAGELVVGALGLLHVVREGGAFSRRPVVVAAARLNQASGALEYQLRCGAGGLQPAGLGESQWVTVGVGHHQLVPPTAQTAKAAAATVALVAELGDPSLIDQLS